jgi:hypothetical protein
MPVASDETALHPRTRQPRTRSERSINRWFNLAAFRTLAPSARYASASHNSPSKVSVVGKPAGGVIGSATVTFSDNSLMTIPADIDLPWGTSVPAGPTPAAAPPATPGGVIMVLPLWIPLSLLGYLVWRSRFAPVNLRRTRRKLGLCLRCGYNLQGLTEPRCPECATTFERVQEADAAVDCADHSRD